MSITTAITTATTKHHHHYQTSPPESPSSDITITTEHQTSPPESRSSDITITTEHQTSSAPSTPARQSSVRMGAHAEHGSHLAWPLTPCPLSNIIIIIIIIIINVSVSEQRKDGSRCGSHLAWPLEPCPSAPCAAYPLDLPAPTHHTPGNTRSVAKHWQHTHP
eukprot:1478248-Rhodomonas_salina.1